MNVARRTSLILLSRLLHLVLVPLCHLVIMAIDYLTLSGVIPHSRLSPNKIKKKAWN
nr:MAG TPA: hypothetical protein [Caudoviricetes sp.]